MSDSLHVCHQPSPLCHAHPQPLARPQLHLVLVANLAADPEALALIAILPDGEENTWRGYIGDGENGSQAVGFLSRNFRQVQACNEEVARNDTAEAIAASLTFTGAEP